MRKVLLEVQGLTFNAAYLFVIIYGSNLHTYSNKSYISIKKQ